MERILFSVSGKIIISLVLTFGSGFLCSSLVTEITQDGKVKFSLLISTKLTWITVLFIVLLAIYYIRLAKIEFTNSYRLQDYQDQELLKLYKGQFKELGKLAKKQAKLGNLEKLDEINNYAKGVMLNGSTINDKAGKDQSSGTS